MSSNTLNNPSAIWVDNLSWQVKTKVILDRLCFRVEPGEFVGLIGPNGAGKSSLLRCLYRKTIPTTGTIQFSGRPVESYSRRSLARQIAVVQQESPAQFDLSVRDVISMGLTPHKSLLAFDTREDYDQVTMAAHKVDVAQFLDQQFNSLSGGEKQRAMIARAIVQQPSVLLMDEPTNHLDVHHQIEVLELARAMKITVVVSIHDLNLAAAFCDRLLLLDRGAIVAAGSSQDVLTEQVLAQVFAVNAQVDAHPFGKGPRITFDFGGRQS